ncbi:J domain-containing protein [bacterium]|nr:MAG: J domain-containing protein [bacterium]
MESRLHKAYETLGLPSGSSLETIKRKHRELVKIWHPDKHQHHDEKHRANAKIAEINAAYAYLRSIKERTTKRKKQDPTTAERPKQSTSHTANSAPSFSQATTNQKKAKTKTNTSRQNRYGTSFQQSKLDSILSGLQNRFSYWQLKKKREIRKDKWRKMMESERAYWVKLREKYDERTRVGLYRSLFNALVFGRIIQFESGSTALGLFTIQEKYEIDLRHNLINDQIFYSINKGLNLLLKYVFGGFSLLLFFYLTLMYYAYGKIPTLDDYLLLQMGVVTQASLLFIPDNLFQRGLLWKYRHLRKMEIQQTFANKTLPGKWNKIIQVAFLIKYAALFLYLSFFLKQIPTL